MIDLAAALAATGPSPTPGISGGIQFDLTITLGNILTVLSMLGVIALYVVDTRYASSGARGEVRKIGKAVEALSNELKNHADEDRTQFELVRSETREVVAAIRTKVNEVELYTRDTFVRRDSLREIMADQQRSISGMITDLKEWMRRIEGRLNGESV